MFFPTQLLHYEQTEVLLQTVILFIIVVHLALHAMWLTYKLLHNKSRRRLGSVKYSKLPNHDTESIVFKRSGIITDLSTDE